MIIGVSAKFNEPETWINKQGFIFNGPFREFCLCRNLPESRPSWIMLDGEVWDVKSNEAVCSFMKEKLHGSDDAEAPEKPFPFNRWLKIE